MATDSSGDGTGDCTGGTLANGPRDARKLTVVGGDSPRGGGHRFQAGNKWQRIGNENRRRPQPVNTVAQLDLMARRVVRDLFRSIRGKEMTAQVATAIFSGLRFRSELYGSYQAAEELAKVQAKYSELEARFIRLKQNLGA
jgi:hypothetical protein